MNRMSIEGVEWVEKERTARNFRGIYLSNSAHLLQSEFLELTRGLPWLREDTRGCGALAMSTLRTGVNWSHQNVCIHWGLLGTREREMWHFIWSDSFLRIVLSLYWFFLLVVEGQPHDSIRNLAVFQDYLNLSSCDIGLPPHGRRLHLRNAPAPKRLPQKPLLVSQ